VSEIILISHPDVAFVGARRLLTAQDAHLLAVTRTPLHCAARRLLEEGFDRETLILIKDSAGAVPNVRGKIANILM
jgi:hypothetical protein